jgi:hypothetical protein
VVAEGELTGHAHAFPAKRVKLFREKKSQRSFLTVVEGGAPLPTRSTGPSWSRPGITSCAGSGNMPRLPLASAGIDRDANSAASPDELARIPEFIDKWTRIGLSTIPVDYPRAERALCRLYAGAGLAEPAVVWAPCPMTAMLSHSAAGRILLFGGSTRRRDAVARYLGLGRWRLDPTRRHRPCAEGGPCDGQGSCSCPDRAVWRSPVKRRRRRRGASR